MSWSGFIVISVIFVMSVVVVVVVVVVAAARKTAGIKGLGTLKLFSSDLGLFVLVRRLSLFEDRKELLSLRAVLVRNAATVRGCPRIGREIDPPSGGSQNGARSGCLRS